MTGGWQQLVNEYIHFQVFGKQVNIPYSMVLQPGEKYDPKRVTRTTISQHDAAKGTPEQIRQDLILTAQQHHFNLKKATSKQIHQFMLDQGIGIDCSGYVYHLLDGFLKQNHQKSLDNLILRYPGLYGRVERWLRSKNRVRRSSAATLTSELNTVEIPLVKDMQAGDMIRLTDPFWSGKHIALIVEKTPTYIVYTHASERTVNIGPHLAKIKIVNQNAGLEKQVWLEKLLDGTNYRNHAFKPEKGDGVRRLKFLAK